MAGGMGGMGGGLMGTLMRSAMGGMHGGAGQMSAPQSAADEYDVDRWKRADGLDNTTMVQAVRSDWDRKQSEKQARGLGQKIKTLLNKRKKAAEPEPTSGQATRPAGGTVTTPEMKKASQRIRATGAQETVPAVPEQPRHRCSERENYLGLRFQTELGGFFTENPVNSAILAVDGLGLGPLTLNQVTGAKPSRALCQGTAASSKSPAGDATPDEGAETSYMNALRQSREQRKYEIRIT